MSLFVIAILALIFVFLGSAVIGLLRGGKAGSDRMFKALKNENYSFSASFCFLVVGGTPWLD